jgi:ferrous iron transport protein B
MRPSVKSTATQAPASNDEGVIALVGSPNSGKTTLFNWITGSRFKTVNYPGATVDYSVGTTHERFGDSLKVMDTPGTYSLDPKSPDERVTLEAIYAHRVYGASKVVISVADATNLGRQLFVTKQLIESGFRVVLAVTMSDLTREQGQVLDTAELANELRIPVVSIDGRLGGGVQELIDTVRKEHAAARKTPHEFRAWDAERIETTLKQTTAIAGKVLKLDTKAQARKQRRTARERTRAIDRWLLHPVWGLLAFIGLMTALFSSIFWAAAPVMDVVDKSLSWAGDQLLALDQTNLVLQFLANGVIASVASVFVFVPQIFILFIGIVLLEDSGYLARSATLIDKPLSKLGLGGRSFVPLLSGYACAVPAMMAARTINSKRERWLTLFIIPLMSCSARLPVYALLLSFLFHDQPAWRAGLMLTGIYFASLIVGAIAALIAGQFLKIDDKSFFMLELPVYRKPQLRLVLRQAFTRTQNYVRRAGPPIFAFALLVWLATTFPHFRADPSERLSTSYAAQAGRLIEPVFEPMGGDWRTGVGLISAFAAREVFVSSLAVVFQVADKEATLQDTLLQKMTEAKAPNGMPLFTVATVLGLIVFFMIALQCLSTVIIAVRESGGWKFALVQLIVFNVVAYVLAVGIVQGLRAIGIA